MKSAALSADDQNISRGMKRVACRKKQKAHGRTVDEGETDSIVSVLEVLETMDEEGVIIPEKAFSDMITALSKNVEYIPS